MNLWVHKSWGAELERKSGFARGGNNKGGNKGNREELFQSIKDLWLMLWVRSPNVYRPSRTVELLLLLLCYVNGVSVWTPLSKIDGGKIRTGDENLRALTNFIP